MADIIPPSPVDAPFGSYNWADWFNKVRNAINSATNLAWAQITDFTGSNLNQLQTRSHQSLQNVLGTTTPNTAFGHAPVAGSAGQVLIKNSSTDYDYSWGIAPPVMAYDVGDNSGNVTASSATFVTFAGLASTIPAVVGDIIKIDFSVNVQSATVGATTYLVFGLFCNGTHTGQSSVLGLTTVATATIDVGTYSFIRVVQSGDLSAGNFICDIRYKTTGASSIILNSTGGADTFVPVLTLTNYG